jgi:hypothetical protein
MAVSLSAPPPPLSLPSGAALSTPVALACAPLSLSALRARLISVLSCFPRTPAPSCCAVGPPSQLRLPRYPPWTSMHARTPRSPTTSPAHAASSLLSTASTSLHHPISRKLALSRALPLLLDLAGDPYPSCRSSSPPEAVPSDPKLRPEVRHPFPFSVSPNSALSSANSASPEFARARAVTGRISPVRCPCVGP